MSDTVTVVTPGSREDRYGNPMPDWADDAVTTTTVTGCAWSPSLDPEDRSDGRQGVPAAGTLYVPPGAAVAATDRIVVRGDIYDVDAEPAVWRHPTSGATRGVEVRLRRFAG